MLDHEIGASNATAFADEQLPNLASRLFALTSQWTTLWEVRQALECRDKAIESLSGRCRAVFRNVLILLFQVRQRPRLKDDAVGHASSEI